MEQKNADELKARSRAAFDAQAETYDAGMQGDHARGLYRIVAGEVARACGGIDSPRVLDLGCGTGALAEIVLDEIPGCALVGVDLSANMAERAAERLGGRAEVVVGDAERLPFRDNLLMRRTATTRSTITPIRRWRRSRCGARCARAAPSSSATYGSRRPRAPS